jgi:outer membrane protein OmpA-like peptidoglycan-associated protein
VAGVLANHGCPLVQDSLVSRIDAAARNCFFATGSSRLLAASFPALDELVKILKEYPNARLFIEGHTDSQGNADANKILSKNRALAVLDYLAQKGIAKDRLRSEGFGPARPIADNSSPQGRAMNRRVAMKLLISP